MSKTKSFKVLASGGVHVRELDSTGSASVRVLKHGEVISAEVTPGRKFIRVDDGYVLNEPYLLQVIDDSPPRSSSKK